MTSRKKLWVSAAGTLSLTVLALFVSLPPNRGGFLSRFVPGIRLGLDLRGGSQLVYQADLSGLASSEHERALDGVREVIERRVNAFGVLEPLLQVVRRGEPRVLVELPGVQDVEAAIRQIGETPQLDFRKEETVAETLPGGVSGDTWTRTALTGRHLKRAEVAFHPQTGEPQVSLVFDGEGRKLFAELTEQNVGKRIAIFLDGSPITAPVVEEKITAGEAVITGTFTIPEAKQLATRLNAGALPVPITLVSRTSIGPSLGRGALLASFLASLLGVTLLTVIMLSLYRLPGVLAVIALSLYALLLFAILATLGATLTVSGIAGFLLSLGMAVDANILVFERLKESVRSGLAVPVALTEGFREAWPSIRDSNVASLLTAGLLYAFGSSVVRGFATTLALGILVSMFTALVTTRTLLRLTLQFRRFHAFRWYVPSWKPAASTAGKPYSVTRAGRYWLMLSGALSLLSVFGIISLGLRPGIDFQGGSLLELRAAASLVPEIRSALERAGETLATVQDTGDGTILVRMRPLTTDEHTALLLNLRVPHPSLEEVRFETVGPTIGRELLRKAVIAVALAILLILGYLALAFRKTTHTVSPWAFGAIAIVALVHDVLIMTGGFAVLARSMGAAADSLFLTAVLTLLGFSVHDTIVVFNRIKTNLLRLRLSFREIVDRSILETFTRSVNTSATTLVTLLAIFFFGGSTIRPFAATLSLGMVVGTYSSIFVASPLLVWWQARRAHG